MIMNFIIQFYFVWWWCYSFYVEFLHYCQHYVIITKNYITYDLILIITIYINIPAQGKHTYTTLSNVLWYYFDMNCGWFIYHLNNVFILWFLYSKIITLCDNKYLISFSAVRVGFTLNTLDVCLDNKTILYGCWCSLQMNI
jgi:hypothetical protein